MAANFKPGAAQLLGPEGLLVADVLLAAVSRWSFASRDLSLSLDLPDGCPERVSAYVLERIGSMDGFAAELADRSILVTRDSATRRPYQRSRKR